MGRSASAAANGGAARVSAAPAARPRDGRLLEKNPHVRIVATAVTLESAAALTACMREFEFSECVSLSIAKARAAGPYHLMAGQNPIYIFTLQNGGNTP